MEGLRTLRARVGRLLIRPRAAQRADARKVLSADDFVDRHLVLVGQAGSLG